MLELTWPMLVGLWGMLVEGDCWLFIALFLDYAFCCVDLQRIGVARPWGMGTRDTFSGGMLELNGE